jgi:hypothetical protein
MDMMQKLMALRKLGVMGQGQQQKQPMPSLQPQAPMGQPSKIPIPPDAMNRMSGGNPAGTNLMSRGGRGGTPSLNTGGIQTNPEIMAMIEDMMRRGRRRI